MADDVQPSHSFSDLPEIFCIPPEMMHMIFSFCSELGLVFSVQFVCRRWQELIKSDCSWRNRTLTLRGKKLKRNFVTLIRQATFVTSLSFEKCSFCFDIIELLSHHQQLTSLKLHSPITDWKNLTNLSFLEKLDMNMIWKETDYQYLFQLSSISTIETIVLRNLFSSSTLAAHLVNTCPQLQHLVLTKLEIIEEYILKETENNLPNNEDEVPQNSLKTVYVYGENFLSREILYSVGKIKTLSHVVLKPTDYSDSEYIQQIFSETMYSLKTLDIGYASCVSDTLLKSVSQCCPNLENLILTRCNISDKALSFISNLYKLKRLNLHGTRVTSAGLDQLPLYFPNLTDLNVLACRRMHHCHLSDLVHKLPRLLIVLPRYGLLSGKEAVGRASPFLPFRNEINSKGCFL